jgi:hypothetical protein
MASTSDPWALGETNSKETFAVNPAFAFPRPDSLLRQAGANGRAFQFLIASAAEVGLEPWPRPTIETEGFEIDADVERLGRVLWKSPDECEVVLIESLAPCVISGPGHGGEVLYFLEGRVRCEPAGGESHSIVAGDICWFERGLEDVWHVEERYTKVMYGRADTPLPYPGPR